MLGPTEIVILCCSILLVIIVKLLMESPKAPTLNIYQNPNGFYWLKVVFMYLMLTLKKRKLKNSPDHFEKLDKPQKLSYHDNAIDAVYFNGANGSGDHLVVGTARRKEGLIDGFLYLKIEVSDLGVLETPKLPGTSLYQKVQKDTYEAEGLKVNCIEPMKRWRITYKGKMKLFQDRQKMVEVFLDVEWSSVLPYFNFDTDMDTFAMAKSVAMETWSREYFQTLQDIHQTHYEQHGDITGSAIVDGKSYQIKMNAVRDHSFGVKREWRNFHRYGLHFLAAENGDRFTVGTICMPIAFSRLTMGYVYSAKEKKLHPVQSCDLQLYQHGEQGVPPLDYAFSFVAGGRNYTIQVKVIDSPAFYISKDWESKIVERLCTFSVNGVKAWGAAEWQYRNILGKGVKEHQQI